MPSSTPTTETGQLRPAGRPLPTGRGRARVALAAVAVLGVVAGAGWIWLRGAIGPIPVREHCTATANSRTTGLDPEQAGNAATIAAIAVQRQLPARAASIGIATAIQESKLRNLDYGDRDSLGLFQQRPSQGWGTAEQIRDPVYATNAFFDVLIKVDGYRQMAITDVAQKVQRSAFPSAYADHAAEGRILASALAGYSPAGLTCILRAPTAPGDPQAVAEAAQRETGLTGTLQARTLTYRLSGEDAARRGWSLAQWAVARADGLGVSAVSTGSQRWSRARSTDGWQPDGAAPGDGTVTLEVAG